MYKAGIVALTDDGHCVQNHELMRRALEYARMFGLIVMDHCQDGAHAVAKGILNPAERPGNEQNHQQRGDRHRDRSP